ncbi:DUF4235 domain-containing protein [Alkalilimnicola ehrlichii]|nr:DUF4235 domain-containing protein [Alkalilimnicola ehrlichii]
MRMKKPVESAVVAGSSMLAVMGVDSLLKAGWRRTRHEEPPLDPSQPDIPWQKALMWVAVSSLAIAVAKFVVARGAAARMRRQHF